MHRNPVSISRSVLESEWCPGLPGVTSRKKQLPPGDLPSSQSLLAPTGAMHTPPTGPSSGWTWCQWPHVSPNPARSPQAALGLLRGCTAPLPKGHLSLPKTWFSDIFLSFSGVHVPWQQLSNHVWCTDAIHSTGELSRGARCLFTWC